MKKKHLPVIIFSSSIVAIVFFSTLAGYHVYMQYKKDVTSSNYRNSIYELTADIFRPLIVFNSVAVKKEGSIHPFPVLEGNVRNNSNKTVLSLLLEITFVDTYGRVLYKEWFHPVGDKYFDGAVFFPSQAKRGDVLMPGDSLSFMHEMRNCPVDVIERLATRRGFARPDPSKDVKLVYTIKGLKVL